MRWCGHTTSFSAVSVTCRLRWTNGLKVFKGTIGRYITYVKYDIQRDSPAGGRRRAVEHDYCLRSWNARARSPCRWFFRDRPVHCSVAFIGLKLFTTTVNECFVHVAPWSISTVGTLYLPLRRTHKYAPYPDMINVNFPNLNRKIPNFTNFFSRESYLKVCKKIKYCDHELLNGLGPVSQSPVKLYLLSKFDISTDTQYKICHNIEYIR